MQCNLGGWRSVEENRHVVAESDVLAPLSNVEGNLRGSLSGVTAVNLKDLVFVSQPGKPRAHRGLLSQRNIYPPVFRCFWCERDLWIRLAVRADKQIAAILTYYIQ